MSFVKTRGISEMLAMMMEGTRGHGGRKHSKELLFLSMGQSDHCWYLIDMPWPGGLVQFELAGGNA